MCRDDHVILLHTEDLHYNNMWLYKKMFRKRWCTYCAVRPNIDTDQWYKNFIAHAYSPLHISDRSTTQKNKHRRPSTQAVQYGTTTKTVSIDHLRQNAGTICTKHTLRRNQTLMYCK